MPAPSVSAETLHDPEQVRRILSAPTNDPSAQLTRYGANLILAVAIVTGAWSAAALTWRIFSPPDVGAVSASLPSPSLAPTVTRTETAAIIAAELFGPEPRSAVAAKAAPNTALSLVLKGIIFSDEASGARAIISAPNQAQAAFRVGQAVANNVTLKEVHRSYVIINNNGQHERLVLEDGVASSKRRGASGPPDQSVDHRGDYQMAKVLGRVQTRLRTDPASVMTMMRIMPVESGSDLVGVRIFPGPEPGLFDRFKLEPGDVLTEVNGIPLDSTARGLEVLRNLTGANEIALSLVRGKKRLEMSYSISQ